MRGLAAFLLLLAGAAGGTMNIVAICQGRRPKWGWTGFFTLFGMILWRFGR